MVDEEMMSFLLFVLIGVVLGVVVSEGHRRFGNETKGWLINCIASMVALTVITSLSVGVVSFLYAFFISGAFLLVTCYVHDLVFKPTNKS